MKLVCLADPHFHVYQDEGRLDACYRAASAAFDRARAERCPLILAGDLFQVKGSVPVAALNSVYRLFSENKDVEVLAIPGNHDLASADGSVHALEILKEFKNVRVFDYLVDSLGLDQKDLPVWASDGYGIIFIPFLRDRDLFRAALEKTLANLRALPLGIDKLVLVAHCYTNELMKRHVGVDGDFSAEELARDFDLVLLGHQHQHDVLVTKNAAGRRAKVVSIGAPLQHNFGDRGQKRGFVVVDLDTLEIDHVLVKSPEFVSIDPGGAVPEDVSGATVRVRVESKGDAAFIKRDLLAAGAARVVVEIAPEKKSSRIDIAPGSDDRAVLEKFLSSDWGKSPLETSKLLSLGLRYLGVVPKEVM